jgi:signal transduction histidine kinase
MGIADLVLALVLVALLVPMQWGTPPGAEEVDFRDPDLLGAALLVASALPVAWRRRWPMPVFLLTAVPAVTYEALGYPTVASALGALVALYTVAAHCERTQAFVAAGLTALGLAVVLVTSRAEVTVATIASNGIIFATAWLVGDNVRTRRAYVASLQERARRAEEARLAEADRAVAEERARIARELHDVVAHSMSVMIVQAGAARRVMRREPDQAAEALSSIESTGRQAMGEMRRLLGVLRDDSLTSPALLPQPSMGSLGALVDQCRAAGLPVDLQVEGEPSTLGPGIDLTAYRIVQEALTNVLKHAGPATAVVRVVYGPESLELTIDDDGRGSTATSGDGSGQGLVGMQERVDLFGGALRHGPRAGGGFSVRAVLPLPARVS